MSSRRQALRLISVLTLAAQLLGFAHLAFEAHTLTAAGQVIEPTQVEADAHESAGHHLCNSSALETPDPGDACLVGALWTASGLLRATPGQHVSVSVGPGASPVNRRGGDAQDVLSRAPKASPPVA